MLFLVTSPEWLSRVSDTLCAWLFKHNLNGLFRVDDALAHLRAEGHYEDHHIPTSNHVNCLFQLPAERSKEAQIFHHHGLNQYFSTYLACKDVYRVQGCWIPVLGGWILFNHHQWKKTFYYIPHGWAGPIISAWPTHQLGPACSLCDSIKVA